MASYSVTRHDGEFFVQRNVEGVSDYVGPFHHSEFQAVLKACRNGTFDWSRHDPFDEIGPPRRWPQLEREHRVDVQRGEQGYFVVVDKPPMFVQRGGGGLLFSGQYKAFYPSREEARLAATHILATVATRGELNEREIDDRIEVGRPTGAAETSAFEVRSRRPPRRGERFSPITDAARRHRVAFYGDDDVAVTPPLPNRRVARELADKLERLHRRGASIPFRPYRFSKLRPSDRRVFVDQVDGRPYVLVDGPDELGRLGPFETEQDAAAIRQVLAREIRRVESIRWDAYRDAYGLTWGEHPDRLRVAAVPEGFRLEYQAEDRIGFSDKVYRSKREATRHLDTQRLLLYRGETLDPARWSFYSPDEEAFAEDVPSIARQPTGPETAVDRLAETLRSGDVRANDDAVLRQLDQATDDVSQEMLSAREPLTSSQERLLLDDLGQYALVRETRAEARMVRAWLDHPRFDPPIRDPGDRRDAEAFSYQVTSLESHLAELPREDDLAARITRRLQGKDFDPGALARQFDQPFDSHASDLLTNVQTVQRDYLPRVRALAEAAQKAGREVPLQLLDPEHLRWIGTIRNLAPPQIANSIAIVHLGIQKARVLASERAGGITR